MKSNYEVTYFSKAHVYFLIAHCSQYLFIFKGVGEKNVVDQIFISNHHLFILNNLCVLNSLTHV